MPIRVVCRSCDRSIKVKDDLAGRRVNCPDCGKVLVVPEEEADERPLRKRDRDQEEGEDERPRRSGGNKRSKKGLIIGLFVGGGVLAAGLAAGLTVLLIVLLGSRDNPNATEENFDKIKPSMSQEEVEKILGKGEKVSYNAVNEALHARPSRNPSTGDAQTYRWKNKSDTILLVIAPSGGGPGKGVIVGWFVREQKGDQPKHKGLGAGKLLSTDDRKLAFQLPYPSYATMREGDSAEEIRDEVLKELARKHVSAFIVVAEGFVCGRT